MQTRLTALVIPVLLLAACSQEPIAPDSAAGRAALSSGAPKFWETGATVAWNEVADRLLARRPTNALRVDTYLALAQLRAAEAAKAGAQPHPPVAAAIGGASVAVLSVFFPLDIAELEAALDAQEAADPWPGAKHADFAAGERSAAPSASRSIPSPNRTRSGSLIRARLRSATGIGSRMAHPCGGFWVRVLST
jgi:hypothetical protein